MVEEEALHRAKKCIEAGVDGIMIHSKEKSPDEVLEFLDEYAKFEKKVPIVAVPTTYNSITEKELAARGVRICIYANHLLRAAYPGKITLRLRKCFVSNDGRCINYPGITLTFFQRINGLDIKKVCIFCVNF